MSNIQIAILGGIAGMIGYGVSDFLAKKSIDKIGDLRTLLYAQLIGAVFIIPLLIGKPLPTITLTNILYIAIFGFFSLISYILLYRAFSKGKVSIISPISSSYAILTAVTSFLFFAEPFSGIKAFFLVLVLLGIFLTSVDLKLLKNGFNFKDFSKGIPEIMAFFVIAGVYVPFWNKFLAVDGWMFWVFAVRLILSGFLLIYMSIIKASPAIPKQKSLISLLVFVALFEAFASFGSSWGLHHSVNASSVVAATTSAYPLITVLLGYVFLRERLANNQYFGVIIIILGLILSPFL